MLSFAALALLSVIAALWPIIGFVVLLVLTSSLFHLSQYVTMPFSIGFVEPLEAMLASAAVGTLLLGRRPLSMVRQHATRNLCLNRLLVRAIVPYVLWQLVCVIVGLLEWSDTEHFKYGLRFLLRGLLPWCSLYVLLRLSGAQRRRLFTYVYWLAAVVAGLHLVIQALDVRSVMYAAYYDVPIGAQTDSVAAIYQNRVAGDTFVRGLPQGVMLILFCLIDTVSRFFTEARLRTRRYLPLIGLFLAALLITFTRSLVLPALFGVVLTLVCVHFACPGRLVLPRAGLLAVSVLGLLIASDLVRPQFVDFWMTRLSALNGADSKIFSKENTARGLDNLASLAALSEHPILGLGTTRYPAEYSLRSVPPSDIHPLLELGLVGGIPAIVLAIRMQFLIFAHFFRYVLSGNRFALVVTPFCCVIGTCMMVVNTVGAGGTLTGIGIVITCIFLAHTAGEMELLAHALPKAGLGDRTAL